MSSALDVKWPIPSLLLESQHFGTYPSQPVIATIKYNGISCVPANGIPVAAYSLQLIYCGTTDAACDPQNNSRTQVSDTYVKLINHVYKSCMQKNMYARIVRLNDKIPRNLFSHVFF